MDDNTGVQGMYDYFWGHALNSDETNARIHKYCNFVSGNSSIECEQYQNQGLNELGNVDIYNIYAPICNESESKSTLTASVSISDISTNTFSNFKCLKYISSILEILLF